MVYQKDEQLTLLIVEDDKPSLTMVQRILADHFPHFSITLATTLAEAASNYAMHAPQILLLDINLPDGDAFTLLEQLRTLGKSSYQVIFMTGHSEHALQAIKYSALDFLLKPYAPADLVSAVKKAAAQINDLNYHKQLEAFIYNVRADNDRAKLVLKTVDETHIVKLNDIVHIQADDNYCRFHLVGGASILLTQPLKTFERKLDDSGFVRVHQSHLANLIHIKSFNRKKSVLNMAGGTNIPVSQGKRNELSARLDTLSAYL